MSINTTIEPAQALGNIIKSDVYEDVSSFINYMVKNTEELVDELIYTDECPSYDQLPEGWFLAHPSFDRDATTDEQAEANNLYDLYNEYNELQAADITKREAVELAYRLADSNEVNQTIQMLSISDWLAEKLESNSPAYVAHVLDKNVWLRTGGGSLDADTDLEIALGFRSWGLTLKAAPEPEENDEFEPLDY